MQKRSRKLIAWAMLFVMVLGLLTVSGKEVKAGYSADTQETDDGWVYKKDTVAEKIYISGYNGNDTEIVIPSEIEGWPVTTIESICRSSQPGQEEEDYRRHADATSVSIPNSVTRIGSMAFYHCEGLTQITIPNGVVEIESDAFTGCKGLRQVTIPGSVKTIDGGAFANCENLAEITIPEGVETIGAYAFLECKNLEKVEISSTVTKIGMDSDVNFTDYEGSAFWECDKLSQIIVSEDNTAYTSLDGCLYDKNMTTLFACPNTKISLDVPEGVTRIGDGAFSENENLKEVQLPSTLKAIGDCAFWVCRCLEEIHLPESLESIGRDAFTECYSLKEFFIPKNVKTIGNSSTGAFGDHQIKSFSVDAENAWFTSENGALYSKDMKTLYAWPAQDHTKQVSAFIPDTVEEIRPCAFYGRSDLASIWIPQSVATLDVGEVFNDFSDRVIVFYDPEYTELQNNKGHWTFKPYSGEMNPFTDVRKNKFYSGAVLWAYHNDPQITTGTSDTTFSPLENCNRAQVVTFLWRLAGSPEPTTTKNPFTDVKRKDYFYKAVLWAVENNITTGTGKTTFSPKNACTRADFVTFLWRACGSPAPTDDYNPFVDVSKKKYYANAVLWARERGITTGTDDSHFSPKSNVNRAQTVTFLFRARGFFEKHEEK